MKKLKVFATYNGYTKIDIVLVSNSERLVDIYNNLQIKFKTKNIVLKSCEY